MGCSWNSQREEASLEVSRGQDSLQLSVGDLPSGSQVRAFSDLKRPAAVTSTHLSSSAPT